MALGLVHFFPWEFFFFCPLLHTKQLQLQPRGLCSAGLQQTLSHTTDSLLDLIIQDFLPLAELQLWIVFQAIVTSS